jgi:hypothetical protein
MNLSNIADKSENKKGQQDKETLSVITAVRALKSMGSDDEDSQCPMESVQVDMTTGALLDCELKLSAVNEGKNEKGSACRWLNESVVDFSGLTFTQKMHHVLRNVELIDVISWLPSGQSFVIRNPKKFVSEVAPKYFGKNIAYTSFTRRLGRWGWQNIARATYYNPNFNRDHPEKCLLMTYNINNDNKRQNFRPTKSCKAVKQNKKETFIKPANSSNHHLLSQSRGSATTNSEEARIATTSIQGMFQGQQQFSPSSNFILCTPLFPYQHSSTHHMVTRCAPGGEIGCAHPASSNHFQQLNLVGPSHDMLINNYAKALHQSQIELRLRQSFAAQAAALPDNQALAMALAALEGASKSFSSNEI